VRASRTKCFQLVAHAQQCTSRAGEVTAGVLTVEGKAYMLVVGEAPKESSNTATLIYDFLEDAWLLGSPRLFVGNHHASEVIDNKMYLFGGLDSGNHTIQIASLMEVPQGIDVQWSYGADLPVPGGSGITALINGLVRHSVLPVLVSSPPVPSVQTLQLHTK
jgi:hypothetical protein